MQPIDRVSRYRTPSALLFACVLSIGAARPQSPVTTFVAEPLPPVRIGGVVAGGLSFQRGRWSGEEPLAALVGGRCVSVQSRILRRHDDGSVRTARVTFPLPGSSRAKVGVTLLCAEGSVDGGGLTLHEDPDGVRIASGALTLRVTRDVAIPILDVRTKNGRRAIGRMTCGTAVGPGRLDIEEAGPWRAVLRQRGLVAFGPTSPALAVDRRVVVSADAAVIEVETWFFDDAHRGTIADIDLLVETEGGFVGVETSKGRAKVQARGAAAVEWSVSRDGAASLTVDDNLRGEESCDGLRIATAPGAIDVAFRDAEYLGPIRIANESDDRWRIGLVSPEYHWWPGVRFGKAVRFTLHETSPRRRVDAWSEAVFTQRSADLWFLRTAGLAPPVGNGDSLLRRLADVLEPYDRDDMRLEHGLLVRGEEDAGDFKWSRSDWGNLEFDTILGEAVWSQWRNDATPFRRAMLSARHLVQRDLDLARSGLPLRHGAFHRFGGLEAGHMWLEGLIAVVERSADPFLVDALDELRLRFQEFIAACPIESWNMRSVAWGLLAASALAEFYGEVPDIDLVRRLQSTIVDAAGGRFIAFEHAREPEGARYLSTWVASGILAEAIDRSLLVHPDEALERRRDDHLRALAEASWHEETKEVYAGLVVASDDGRVLTSEGASNGEEMLFWVAGLRGHSKSAAAPRGRLDAVAGAAFDRLRLDQKILRGMELSQLRWLLPRLARPP